MSLRSLCRGCRLCALSVRLVAQYHSQFCYIDPYLFSALGTEKWEFYENSVLIHFCPCFCTANRTVDPQGIFLLLIHHSHFLLADSTLRQASVLHLPVFLPLFKLLYQAMNMAVHTSAPAFDPKGISHNTEPMIW